MSDVSLRRVLWLAGATLPAAVLTLNLAAQDLRIQHAKDALAKQDLGKAVALLNALSQEGDTAAMVLYAELWESGRGVPTSRTEALRWYAIASRLGQKAAEVGRERVAAALPPEKVKEVLGQASSFRPAVSAVGREMDLAGSAYCSYENAKLGKTLAFRPGANAEQVIADVARFGGIAAQNFLVMSGNVPNAAAVVAPANRACPEEWWVRGACDLSEGFVRLVLYNPAWMDEITQQSGPIDWASYSVLAHEIGHHVQGHTLVMGGSRPPLELEADRYSGFVLAAMGATVDEATSLMRSFGPSPGSDTHPATVDRLRAITEGWNDGKSIGGGSSSGTPLPAPVIGGDQRPRQSSGRIGQTGRGQQTPPLTPMPPQSAMSSCATPVGVCLMSIPIPPGYACWCPTMVGPVSGITR